MSDEQLRGAIEAFFAEPPTDCGTITNERSLQLELAYHFRQRGWSVRFEVPLRAQRLDGSTLRQKFNLDLLVQTGSFVSGIELKVPVNGRHPETIYDFCADLEFVESLKRADQIEVGFCIMATNDRAFWTDSGRGSGIHNQFRTVGEHLSGCITKPTGTRDTCVVLQSAYETAGRWRDLDARLMLGGRYLAVAV